MLKYQVNNFGLFNYIIEFRNARVTQLRHYFNFAFECFLVLVLIIDFDCNLLLGFLVIRQFHNSWASFTYYVRDVKVIHCWNVWWFLRLRGFLFRLCSSYREHLAFNFFLFWLTAWYSWNKISEFDNGSLNIRDLGRIVFVGLDSGYQGTF